MSKERTQEGATMEPEEEMTEETFLKDLYAYMKDRDTPIERIPHLGFKQIDLFVMFKTVQAMGGYNQVTAHQLWKQVYNKLGGNPRSTSAATCTRRHYEKLILPYECYLRGEESKDLSLPRQQKRLHCQSFPHEEEGLRGGKRSAIYAHMHAMPQNHPHGFLDTRVRVIPMPVHLKHYFPPVSTALPPYLTVSSAMSPALPHSDSRTFYLPPPAKPKQHLAVLRTLANEYMSSSGWAEPLNLSCKEGGAISEISQQPSSFSPTGNNKMPKFLNKVVPLYQACSIAKEEEAKVLDTKVATATPSPAPQSTCPLPTLKRHVIDFTSSAVSHTSPPVTDSTMKTEAFSTSPPWHNGPAILDALSVNISETDPHSRKQGESTKPRESSLYRSSFMMSPPSDSSGMMEIQIPLALLQDWFKGTFAPGLCNRVSPATLQSGETHMKGGESKSQIEVNIETGSEKPSDVSLIQRHRDRSFTASFAKERHTMNEDHYSSMSYHHHALSPEIPAGDWDPKTDCRGGFAPYHPDMFSKSVTGSNTYLQSEDFVAWKSSPKEQMEAEDLVVKRRSSQVQSVPVKSPLGPLEQEQGSTSPLPWTYSIETPRATLPVLLEPCEKARSMKGPSNVFIVNPTSTSLPSLTQEEYLKLRKLIASSH